MESTEDVVELNEEDAILLTLSLYLHKGRDTIESLCEDVELSEDGKIVLDLLLDHMDNGVVIFPRGKHAMEALSLLAWRKQRLFELGGVDALPEIQ
jgi:hypothetical protein